MTHILKLEFYQSQFKEAHDELKAAEKAVGSAQSKLRAAALALPEVKEAARIAFGAGYNKADPKAELEGSKIVVSVFINLTEEKAQDPAKPATPEPKARRSINMDPKTANVLLQGKLLTDAQKLALVDALTYGVLELCGEVKS